MSMTAPFPSIVPGLVISIVVPESNIYDECDRFISPPEEISFLSWEKVLSSFGTLMCSSLSSFKVWVSLPSVAYADPKSRNNTRSTDTAKIFFIFIRT